MDRRSVNVRTHPREWLRGPAVYADGWLTLDRDRAESYQPMSENDLVFDLANIRSPDDAVAFIRRRGLLWRGDPEGELRERFVEWEEVSRTLYGLLMLVNTLRQAEEGDQEALADLRGRWEPVIAPAFEAPAKDDAELLIQAGVFVAWMVSDGLDGAEQRLECAATWGSGTDGGPGRPSHFGLSIQAQHLVHYAYHELALLLSDRAPLRECSACGRIFEVEDPRQRYCSRSCSGRARQRK